MSLRNKPVILIQSITGTSDFSINNSFYYKLSPIFITSPLTKETK